MAHAKTTDLKDINFILTELIKWASLKEKSFGCFYVKGKGVLHIHVQGGRRFAHVHDGKAWQEIDIKDTPSLALQKKYLQQMRVTLKIYLSLKNKSG